MTIHLPEDLERSIRDEVLSGRFASLDDAMAEAARLLLQTRELADEQVASPATTAEPPGKTQKPIWEVVDELRKCVPPEEFARLPKDGAEQLDHYLYGSPKRPTP
jgi:Arc/MetJ-type ribon-helix-helix transcriptional regulator